MSKKTVDFLKEAYEKASKECGKFNVNSYNKISKIVIHIGIGKIRDNSQLIQKLEKDVEKITGQKPSYTLSKKSISSFKLRKGEKVGIQVTLRREKMADFIYKLINVTLPAIRDFKGLSNASFDKQGNYSFGIKEHVAFPELSFSDLDYTYGLQTTIVFTKNMEESKILLHHLGFPLMKNKEKNA